MSLYSVTDLLAYLRDSSGNSAAVLASFMGAPSPMAADGESEALYVEGSPSHYVTPDDPPILLIHGDADETVPYSQSKLLYEKLKSAGLTAELITMPGGGHGASVVAGPNVPDYKAATVEWFDTYLRGID